MKIGKRTALTSLFLSGLLLVSIVGAAANTGDTTSTTSTTQTTTQTTDTTTTTGTTTTGTTTTGTTTTGTETTPTAKDEKFAKALSDTYKSEVTAKEVASMRSAGYGYGEITKAYGFAALSALSEKPVSVGEITAMRGSMGWGQIAKELNVSVGDVERKSKSVEQAVQKSETTAASEKSKSGHASQESSKSNGNSGNSGGNGGGHGGGNGGGNGGGKK